MGSLMAGWSTSPPCAKKVSRRTTSSLTRDEVKRYWQTKASESREHLEEAQKAAALARPRSSMMKIGLLEEDEDYFPDMNSEGSQPASPTANDVEDGNFKDCWWRRSNYAFLNEPPTQEAKHNNYVAQFHVVDVRAKVAERENAHAAHLHHTRSSLSIF